MQKFLEFIKAEWEVLKKAPFSFVTMGVLAFLMGVGLETWYYSGQISSLKEQINGKDGQIGRYRVALGIDKASQGALIELANEELKTKVTGTVSQLRELCVSLRNQSEQLDAQLTASKANNKTRSERSFRLLRAMSDEFDRKLRADTFNVDNELRRRLGPKAVASIVGVPPSVFSARDGAPLDIVGLAATSGSGMSAGFACTLADGIEQMAKLLPEDSKKP